MLIENINDIHEYCSLKEYQAAEDIYNRDMIYEIDIDYDSDFFTINAFVERDEEDFYEVEMTIDENEIVEKSCDCDQASEHCNHSIAVLIFLVNNEHYKRWCNLVKRKDIDDSISISREIIHIDLKQQKSENSKKQLKEFKGYYNEIDSISELIDSRLISNKKDITQYTVKIIIHKNETDLEFENDYEDSQDLFYAEFEIKKGLSRFYKVQNIKQFIDNTIHNRKFVYGKTTFNDVLNNISSDIKKLLVYIYNTLLPKTESYNNTKRISLSFYDLSYIRDNFFINEIHYPGVITNTVLSIQYRIDIEFNKKNDLLLNPEIIINDKKFNLNKIRLLYGNKNCYLFLNDSYSIISETDRLYIERLKRSFRFSDDEHNVILIKNKVLLSFYNEILPKLEGAYELTGEYDKLKKIISEINYKAITEYQIECYIKYKNNYVYLDMFYIYNKEKYPCIVESPGDIAELVNIDNSRKTLFLRKTFTEKSFYNKIIKSGFLFDAAKKKFVTNRITNNNIDGLIDFIYNIIPNYSDKILFYYNKRFKNKFRKSKSRFHVNLSMTHNIDFLKVNFDWDIDNNKFSIEDLDKFSEDEYIKLHDGTIIPLPHELINQLNKVFDSMTGNKKDDNRFDVNVSNAYDIIDKFSLLADENENIDIDIDERALEFYDRISSDNVTKIRELSKKFNGTLRRYQIEGFNWLTKLSDYYLNGILADDMGLGKTIQTIMLLLSEVEIQSNKLNMVVCPSTLIYNWHEEIERFAPALNVIIPAGTVSQRQKMIDSIDDNINVIITSYPLIKRDFKLYQKYNFNYLILDEAQYIKNHRTLNAQSVKQIQSVKRLVLTGTPIENSLSELWSIFDFLMPGFLKSKKYFSDYYEKPITQKKDQIILNEFKRKISPFILRRTKEQVASDLPSKIEQEYHCELTDYQKYIYMDTLNRIRSDVQKLVEEKGFNKSKLQILSALIKLKLICCHPKIAGYNTNDKDISGKFNMFKELIDEIIEGNHKVVVFSQYVKMLHIMKEYMINQNINFEYLDGTTKNRIHRVNNFNNNPNIKVFLLSLKAGGTGLNLTGADTLIHYDFWWNPAVEAQATDRIYRIGQKHKVTIYKIVTVGTIEEKIIQLQETKKDLIDKVVYNIDNEFEKLSWKDIKTVLNI